MSGHDYRVKCACAGDLRNLFSCVTRAHHSGAFGERKLRFQERIDFAACDVPVLFGNLLQGAQVELESIVACKITDVKQRHARAEYRRSPFYVSGYGNAGWRKIHWKQDVFDHVHVNASCRESPVLERGGSGGRKRSSCRTSRATMANKMLTDSPHIRTPVTLSTGPNIRQWLGSMRSP